jgi:hypothetical protein
LAGVPAMYLLFGVKHEADLDVLPLTIVTEEDMREAMAKFRAADKEKQYAE